MSFAGRLYIALMLSILASSIADDDTDTDPETLSLESVNEGGSNNIERSSSENDVEVL